MGIGPRPVRQPRPPIWIGGSSPAAIRRTAAFGDGWLPQGTRRRDLPGQIARLRALRDEFRGGAPIDIGTIVEPIYLTGGGSAWDLPGWVLSGGADEVATSLRELVEMGVNHLQVRFMARSARGVLRPDGPLRRGGRPPAVPLTSTAAIGWTAMSFFSYALGAIILILVLLRQVRVRPVPRVFQPRLPLVIGVIGLFEMFSYAGDHHVSGGAGAGSSGTLLDRRRRARRVARPLHAGVGGRGLGPAPGQRRSPWACGWCRCWCTSPETPRQTTPGRRGCRRRASCSTWA